MTRDTSDIRNDSVPPRWTPAGSWQWALHTASTRTFGAAQCCPGQSSIVVRGHTPISGSKLTLCRIRNHIFTWATEATEGLESVGSCISSHEQLPGFGRELSRSSASRVMGGEDGSVSGVPVRVDMAQCKLTFICLQCFVRVLFSVARSELRCYFYKSIERKDPCEGSCSKDGCLWV